MINANDLRIGNIINYETPEGEIVSVKVTWEHIRTSVVNPTKFNDCFFPISLTEEILQDFGALKAGNDWIIGALELSHITTEEYYELEWTTPRLDWQIKEIKYVHELQNIYFAITKRELEVQK